jgi:hypothetical protein
MPRKTRQALLLLFVAAAALLKAFFISLPAALANRLPWEVKAILSSPSPPTTAYSLQPSHEA